MPLIFDGHLDLALFALAHNRDQTESVAQINAREAHMTDALERGGATVSLPEMRRAGVAVCQSSISARAKREVQPATGHRCQLAGNTLHAAIGTDTGATYHMPSDFKTTEDLCKLEFILEGRRYSDTNIEDIFHANWRRFFRRWLPQSSAGE